EGGYKQLSDLDPLITQYFIMQSFADATELVFPEEIKNGTVLTSYGTPINIDPDQVTDRVMCVNGVMYGMDDMKAPAIFSSVVGPAFKDTTYVDYLYALDGSNLILSLASNKSEFVALIPTNKQFTDNDPPFRLYTTTQGRSLQQYSADAGDFVNASRGTMLSLVNIHTASNVNQLPATGVQVIPTNSSFNYWFVRNGQITTNSLFNEQLTPGYTGTPYVDFHEITMDGQPWDNGRAYSYDAPQLFAESSGDGVAHLLAIGNDRNYEYYLFSQLLQKAGIASGATLTVAGDDIRNIVFVPTNEAIRQNIDKIPGCSALKIDESYNITGTVSTANKALLANYLRNYFVSSLMNTVASYPYPGSTCKGDFLTMTGATLSIIDNGSTLSVKLDSEAAKTVQVSTKYDSLPFAFSDGCMQLIDDILE
ncbi:MAG: fasciclin domain-containing protein, partial [Prevotella sp.]